MTLVKKLIRLPGFGNRFVLAAGEDRARGSNKLAELRAQISAGLQPPPSKQEQQWLGWIDHCQGTLFEKRQRKPRLSTLIKKAKALGVDVTVGAATFKCGSISARAEIPPGNGASVNPWDEVLSHGTH
jgi:hypothetical protein